MMGHRDNIMVVELRGERMQIGVWCRQVLGKDSYRSLVIFSDEREYNPGTTLSG